MLVDLFPEGNSCPAAIFFLFCESENTAMLFTHFRFFF